MNKKRISLTEAAAELGVSPKTVRRYIANGDLPAEQVNNHLIRVLYDDVQALLKRVPTVEAS